MSKAVRRASASVAPTAFRQSVLPLNSMQTSQLYWSKRHGGIDDIAQDGQEGGGNENTGAFGHGGKIIRYRKRLDEPALLTKGRNFPTTVAKEFFTKGHEGPRIASSMPF